MSAGLPAAAAYTWHSTETQQAVSAQVSSSSDRLTASVIFRSCCQTFKCLEGNIITEEYAVYLRGMKINKKQRREYNQEKSCFPYLGKDNIEEIFLKGAVSFCLNCYLSINLFTTKRKSDFQLFHLLYTVTCISVFQ